MTLPIVLTAAGPQTQAPADINAAILAEALALSPTLTTNLPGSLIEDVLSTGTAIAIVCDQAVVESVNNLTPLAANMYTLNQLGAMNGVVQGTTTNTSVYVTFSGTVGFPIPPGFLVSDGTYTYTVQDGGIVGTGGSSLPLYCVATLSGTWAVPIGSVTGIASALPGGVTLTCTNAVAGVPGQAPESTDSYRSRVLQAQQGIVQGATTSAKTAINAVPGVQSRLVSIQQGNGFKVIVGGGDPYQVAGAIFQSIGDFSALVGSVMSVTNVTNANPGVVTTALNHGYSTGQLVTFNGIVGMTQLNGNSYTITVLTETTFSIGVSTLAFTPYASGGVLTPNLRNQTVAISDYPDIYNITFVNPPLQNVSVTAIWNTNSVNFVSPVAVSAAAGAAIVSYINTIPVGNPINLFEMQALFQEAVAPLVPTAQLTRLVFDVYINGILTVPATGTGLVSGDPESYFYTTSSAVTVSQG